MEKETLASIRELDLKGARTYSTLISEGRVQVLMLARMKYDAKRDEVAGSREIDISSVIDRGK